jgi:hypothetical protein
MSNQKKLSALSRVPLREAWKHEASEFTPWLAQPENLERLSAELGLSELTCVATEHWVGDFKLDMLCSDGSDQVIIENQLEETNHKHLGQLIAYAAGVGAKKIIWIAESFRPEHAAALQFLNENSNDGLAFFGLQIELWQIGDSALAPKFEIVVKPNNWTRSGREQARLATESSPTKQLQLQFWQSLIKAMSKSVPKIRPRTPRAQHWLNCSIGRAGMHLCITANTKTERLGVELYVDDTDSKSQFAALLAQRKSIESKLGFVLDWQELPDAHACRIAHWRPESPIEDESRWATYQDWIAEHLAKMDEVLRPIVKSLP